jgi:hypothetical protein
VKNFIFPKKIKNRKTADFQKKTGAVFFNQKTAVF